MRNPFTKSAALTVMIFYMLAGCSFVPRVDSADDFVPAEGQPSKTPLEHNAAAVDVDIPPINNGNQMKFDNAVVALQSQELAYAETLFTEITKSQPELAGPWVNLALIKLDQNDMTAADAALQQALVANPKNCDALNQLGLLARRAGQFEDAEKYYLRCLGANPSYQEARLNLGILYELYLGRYGEALAMYQDYQLALAKPDPQVNGWLIDLERRVAAIAQR